MSHALSMTLLALVLSALAFAIELAHYADDRASTAPVLEPAE